jgi:hypothetical protein
MKQAGTIPTLPGFDVGLLYNWSSSLDKITLCPLCREYVLFYYHSNYIHKSTKDESILNGLYNDSNPEFVIPTLFSRFSLPPRLNWITHSLNNGIRHPEL